MTLTAYHQALVEHAHTKRFYERLAADPAFRAALAADASAALSQYGMDVSLADLRQGRLQRRIDEIARLKAAWCERFYQVDSVPQNAALRAWRARQIARQRLDLGPMLAGANIHASLAVELTSGCSVGCWFCGLSPERLDTVLPYDEGNAALWRSVLEVLRDRLGPGIRSGFLYWATDPFDNPDYEKFCLDFFDVAGVFPPTTTALPLKDPARTRALLEVAHTRGCWLNRFSVLTVRMLDRIFQEFAAEELALVECMALNEEGLLAYQNAGRFRERAIEDPSLLEAEREKLRRWPQLAPHWDFAGPADYPFNSTACVTGFLVNMAARSVKLVSPCAADDRWPLGYVVFGEATFSSADDLAAILDRLVSTHMATAVAPDRRIRTHGWLRTERLADGLAFEGRFGQRIELRDKAAAAETLHALGDFARAGTMTAGEIAKALENRFNLPPATTASILDRMLALGALDETAPRTAVQEDE